MRELSLDEVKRVELDALIELDRVCREHDLTYLLAYGTLLGAIRHNGFIPWDDDIDVMMPRVDYEMLISHFEEWRSNAKYRIALYRDGESTFQYGKLVDDSTIAQETYVRSEYSVGLWIDLFPIDDEPINVQKVLRRHKRYAFLRDLAIGNPSLATSPARRLFKKVMAPVSNRLDPLRYARFMDENILNAPKCDNNMGVDILGPGGRLLLYDKNDLVPVEHEFEGYAFFVPQGAVKLLEYVYGDWRALPPESERHVHTATVFAKEG